MIRKIEIERFSFIASKGFDEVLAAFKAAIGHPDMAEFWRLTQQTRLPPNWKAGSRKRWVKQG